jgi:hypothetical protein
VKLPEAQAIYLLYILENGKYLKYASKLAEKCAGK